MRLSRCVLLIAMGMSTMAAAAHPAAAGTTDPISACDSASHASTIVAAASPPVPAQAYWLNRHLIQWPGTPAVPGARFRLYHSADAQLRGEPGGSIGGADGALRMDPIAEALPPMLAQRFGFVGEGVRLTVAPADTAAVPGLLRGQVWLVHEDNEGRILRSTALQSPGALDDLYSAAALVEGLGASPGGDGTAFAVWAPTATSVGVCLYDDGRTPAARHLPMRRDDATGVWSIDIDTDLRGRYYSYLVDVFVPGVGMVRNRVTDPYSTSLTTNSQRSYIADLADPALQPTGWQDAPRPPAPASLTDMSVYELHVRDFSVGDGSVSAANRGKYLAFTERDSNGMRHLRGLADAGLTDIHLLPVFDLATVPESGCVSPVVPAAAPDSDAQQTTVMAVAAQDCFNWGYDPFHFNAPEGSYASDAADGAVRIRELRSMVMALQAAGLRVGMDVVYNHTTASGQSPRSVLDRIVPGYYHRLDANGVVERSTCCDNTATEHAMMGKLMIDSAVLWARHYRIDSFRFDLMGHQPREAMLRLQEAVDEAAGRRIALIGEGWDFGEVADGARFVQAAQVPLAGTGVATFSDRARDAIRGGGCCDSGVDLIRAQGYINGLHYAPNDAGGAATREDLLRAADMVRVGLAGTLSDVRMIAFDGVERALSEIDYKGAPAGYAAQPGEVVNYVENHDNATLFDINALKLPRDTSGEDRARVQLLGAALVAFSQGIAYHHAGIEVLRSKSLDRNSFDSGDWFNRLDWTYTDNGFAAGLPPASETGKDWPMLRPILADASIKPTSSEISWMRDGFHDLLHIRASSSLFRMRTAADVQQRLAFRNVGARQNPVVVAAHLDGAGYPGAGFAEILYLVNVSPEAQTLVIDEERGKDYALHPRHLHQDAADRRPHEQARYEDADGSFTVPGRTAVVYVVE
ncbi:MAG: DUF3372 domain-containing protein [Pseudomonadota bacterium]|nr:DUF3372 domain-containing protein [Pseudomonadota bacterium]